MTDNDIIKANYICSTVPAKCEDCPLYLKSDDCIGELAEKTIDLINRQKAEIERLKSPCEMQIEVSEKLENTIKAEAVKEFFEKLKEIAYYDEIWTGEEEYVYKTIDFDEVKDLVEEMVGERDES